MSKDIFKKVESDEEIQKLADKADVIWHEYFPFIISNEQIDYMVDMFLAPHSIKKEMEEGYEFYLIYDETDENIGFMVVKPEGEKLFISKLYLDKEHRGKGHGTPMFEKAQEIAKKTGAKSMYLTVNKQNTPSIEVYKHKGFEVIREAVTDIGNGFVMDDFIMEKTVK